MTALQIDGLAMSFGSTEVLKDVTLTVPERSITAVLGSSGSGKTTLLRIIAGFERPKAGAIRLAGRMIEGPGAHVPPERRGLGYVPQEGALFPHLTVAGNVAFGLRRATRSSHRVAELLDLVNLPELSKRYPHELSGGQQQRVALARALALEPSVVLLDEPFSSLDAALRSSVRADIAGVLRATGTTVVLVTHDQQEAMSMADQVAVLRNGQVAQVGAPRDIYAEPVDPDMAAFLGDANLVEAQIEDSVAMTALGTLRTGSPIRSHAVVLVRPEQITITRGVNGGGGLTGKVLEQSFQGHESVITVLPDRDCGPGTVHVRIQGTDSFEAGTPVTLTAKGNVPAWPR
ncbi:MAG TPA: ABC transporter ATP-binding protein [Pseudonocardiaceae bacterium]|jgi:iron(III) transport system ATP-binding protein|nr:ABC transporter ATP-binding protein [Pseudonocardiaceae bacterium]